MPSVLNVNYRVSIGGKRLKSGSDAPIVALEVEADLNVPAHVCRVVLHGGCDVSAEPGDKVEVELGYDDSLEKVYTGQLASFGWGIEQIRLEALSVFDVLNRSRVNRLYEDKNGGDIASDLLQQLDVPTESTEPGLKFVTYAIGDNLSVWEHLRGLAERCDFVFHANHEDKAVFKKSGSKTTHQFDYGAEILAYERDGLSPGPDGVEVYGCSPSGQGKGDEAISWLSVKEVKGSAGKSSGVVHRVFDPSARNPDLASTLAKNLLEARKPRELGRVRLLGAPKVRLGDALSLRKMPEGALEGGARVVGGQHRLNAREGFVTIARWEGS